MTDPYDAWELAKRRCIECRDAMYGARDAYLVADRRAWALTRESAAAAKAGDVLSSHRLSTAAGPAFEEAAVAWQQYVEAKDEFAAAIQAARDVLPLDAQKELFDLENETAEQKSQSAPSRNDDPIRH